MQCPGQDSRNWKPGDIFDKPYAVVQGRGQRLGGVGIAGSCQRGRAGRDSAKLLHGSLKRSGKSLVVQQKGLIQLLEDAGQHTGGEPNPCADFQGCTQRAFVPTAVTKGQQGHERLRHRQHSVAQAQGVAQQQGWLAVLLNPLRLNLTQFRVHGFSVHSDFGARIAPGRE